MSSLQYWPCFASYACSSADTCGYASQATLQLCQGTIHEFSARGISMFGRPVAQEEHALVHDRLRPESLRAVAQQLRDQGQQCLRPMLLRPIPVWAGWEHLNPIMLQQLLKLWHTLGVGCDDVDAPSFHHDKAK